MNEIEIEIDVEETVQLSGAELDALLGSLAPADLAITSEFRVVGFDV
jgi:hypothetical protein